MKGEKAFIKALAEEDDFRKEVIEAIKLMDEISN